MFAFLLYLHYHSQLHKCVPHLKASTTILALSTWFVIMSSLPHFLSLYMYHLSAHITAAHSEFRCIRKALAAAETFWRSPLKTSNSYCIIHTIRETMWKCLFSASFPLLSKGWRVRHRDLALFPDCSGCVWLDWSSTPVFWSWWGSGDSQDWCTA